MSTAKEKFEDCDGFVEKFKHKLTNLDDEYEVRTDPELRRAVPVSSTKKKPKPKQKPTQARRVNRKIRTALKSDHPSDVYMAMCREVADKMAETASGRDYAALSKTLLDAYVKYTEALTREQEQADQKQREADKIKSPSPLMSARERHLRVVNE